MKGEDVSDDEPEEEAKPTAPKAGFDAARPDKYVDEDDMQDEIAEFGFTSSHAPQQPEKEEKAVQPDEDDFDLDGDLIASGSDVDSNVSDESDGEESASGSDSDAESCLMPGICCSFADCKFTWKCDDGAKTLTDH
jgi:nucleolar protein 14